MASVPFMMQANPKVPANNLAELIALAKQKPGTFTYATPGTGSISHLLGEMLQFEAGIKLIHVPYRGTAQAPLTDWRAGGHQLRQRSGGDPKHQGRPASRSRGHQRTADFGAA